MSLSSTQIKEFTGRIEAYWTSRPVSNLDFSKPDLIGTGFFINHRGLVLTCRHVVEKEDGTIAPFIYLVVKKKYHEMTPLEDLPAAAGLDYVLLQVAGRRNLSDYRVARIGPWNPKFEISNSYFTYGYRSSYFNGLASEGEISGLEESNSEKTKMLVLKSESPAVETGLGGMSGAPIYQQGADRVVGLVQGYLSEGGSKYPIGIPISEILKVDHRLQERYEQTQLFDLLIEIFQMRQWFTEQYLENLYCELPLRKIPPLKELLPDWQTKIVDLFWNEDKLEGLAQFLEGRCISVPISRLRMRMSVNFVNRKAELERAFIDRTLGCDLEPFIFFEAPMGYGKTELLQAIERRHFKEGWYFLYINLLEEAQDSARLVNRLAEGFGHIDLVEEMEESEVTISELARRLRSEILHTQGFEKQTNSEARLRIPGVALLIDNANLLPNNEIKPFLKILMEFHKNLSKMGLSFQVRLAGQAQGNFWRDKFEELGGPKLNVLALSPFRFQYVRETVQRKYPTQFDSDLYAAHLLQITGGHPGCMAKIIDQTGIICDIDRAFAGNDNANRKIVQLFIAEIKKCIPVDLLKFYEELSVFRCYSATLIKDICGNGILPLNEKPFKLMDMLTSTPLHKREGQLVWDNIVRRLFALDLLWQNPQNYIQRCQQALQIYVKNLETLEANPEYLTLECFFQELQVRFYSSTQDVSARQRLFDEFLNPTTGIIFQYLQILTHKENWYDAAQSLLDILQKDDDHAAEFRFTINFFLRNEKYTDEPFQELVLNVKDYVSKKGLDENL